MKITCSKNDLYNGLQIVQKAIPSKTTKDILECVLIDASSNELHLTANDMELGIETIVSAKIEEHGRVCLESKTFIDMIRNLPDDQVSIETNPRDEARIDCLNVHFKLPGRSGDDFPYLPIIPRNEPIKISQFTLREIIQQTIFSISETDVKRVLNGELIEINGNKLRISSLDGHRISIRNIELKDSYDESSVIIPGKSLNEIARILNGSLEDMVYIYLTENHVIFDFDQTTVITRLIEGKFFDINRMLSDDYETKVVINRRDLMGSINRAILLINDSDKKPLIWNVHDQSFEMHLSSTKGNFDEELFIVKEGRDIQIAFNPRFIADVLRVVEDENITIYLLSPSTPCFIRDDAKNYIYVVLPVNFKS
ncbi:MAG: DNA polymerase III subunit beta [Lachnospiraceae bacterium]|nr:DNA polymerase III subunit beta [Lachnospiraceae bacterium]